jgi:hypothetical protein
VDRHVLAHNDAMAPATASINSKDMERALVGANSRKIRNSKKIGGRLRMRHHCYAPHAAIDITSRQP